MKKRHTASYKETLAVTALAVLIVLSVALPKLYYAALYARASRIDLKVTFADTSAKASNTHIAGNKSFNAQDYNTTYQKNDLDRKKTSPHKQGLSNNINKQRQLRCAPFDPNTISGDTLLVWGVRRFIVQNLLKYRESGGRIYDPGGLRRIYGMDSTTFHILAGCVRIDRIAPRKPGVKSIDINTATAEDLKELHGIGDVLAGRIVKFREALGGFVSIEQIGETYGLPSETFEAILPYLTISDAPHKIPVNTVSADELAKHPYITYRQAAAIVAYIGHHGRLASTGDLLNIHSLDTAWLQRIEPYLDWGDGGMKAKLK